MTSQAAIHKRNLESSILFMQQEHANTLKALHEEIQKLQKKCSGNLSNRALDKRGIHMNIQCISYFSMKIQLTLVISTSFIWNNHLSGSENLVLVLT